MWAPWDVAQFRRPFPVVSLARALYTEHLCYPKSTYIFLNCSFLITKNSHLQKEKAEDLSRPELQYRYAHFRYESLSVYSPFLLKCTYILSCSLPFPYPFWIFFFTTGYCLSTSSARNLHFCHLQVIASWPPVDLLIIFIYLCIHWFIYWFSATCWFYTWATCCSAPRISVRSPELWIVVIIPPLPHVFLTWGLFLPFLLILVYCSPSFYF